MAGRRVLTQIQKLAHNIWFSISVEPVLFLHSLGFFTQLVTSENFTLERFCRVILNESFDNCAVMNDGHHIDLQVKVQKLESVFTFYGNLTATIISILLISFIASWSDKRGRRVPILLSLTGHILRSVVYLVESLFPSWTPYILLLGFFFRSIGGGAVMLLMASFSHIADCTNMDSRHRRMAIMSACLYLGAPCGTLLGAWIYNRKGYIWNFSVTLLLDCCILGLAAFIVKVKINKVEEASVHMIKETSPWNPRNVIDLFRVAIRKRPGRTRTHLTLLLTVFVALTSGTYHNMFLWTRRVFHWDQYQYSFYLIISQLVQQITTLVTAPILRRLSVHDCLIGAG
ncbi:Proton-coupled folate transporter-like 8 [Homarus americanus]|uniref:Proton-coupled folate transporter-like 8 n=2 Tax=Homarus americanus TaxID=6706 RepID=A0A8J5JX72_HOMAM|nr:Proton-coupled folate transporter-like 8 [Homarus americanus]